MKKKQAEKWRRALWHPWQDKPGRSHALALWQHGEIETAHCLYHTPSVENIMRVVGGRRLYVLCGDILDKNEFPQSNDLLLDPRTTPYTCETGSVVALRCKHEKANGYFIPSYVWGQRGLPNYELIQLIESLYEITGYEALTPGSLSEKVLKSTLPDTLWIRRPDDSTRKFLLEYHRGGRIDEAGKAARYPMVFEYDKNKAYLSYSLSVPSPFVSPVIFVGNNTWQNMPAVFMEVTMTVHGYGLHPIQVKDNGIMREPVPGETFTDWLWSDEVIDCVEKGYTLDAVHRGFAWPVMSDFMERWANQLWDWNEKYHHPMFKQMMVTVPGRFLRKPYNWTLVPRYEAVDGDIEVIPDWSKELQPVEWCLHKEPDLQSAALTPIGSWIVKCGRRALYKAMREQLLRDGRVLRSYIDCFDMPHPTKTPEMIGVGLGMWKEKRIDNCIVKGNQVIPVDDQKAAKMPGLELNSVFRQRHIEQAIIETSF
jgi:hypothetical protein